MSMFLFFSAIFEGPRFVEIKDLSYHRNVMLRLSLSITEVGNLE